MSLINMRHRSKFEDRIEFPEEWIVTSAVDSLYVNRESFRILSAGKVHAKLVHNSLIIVDEIYTEWNNNSTISNPFDWV